MAIVSLLETLVQGIMDAEEKFFNNPKDFYGLETSVKHAAETFSAALLGEVISSINGQIYDNAWRKNRYSVQRNDKRTIITTVGDVTFDCTYYRDIIDRNKLKKSEALDELCRIVSASTGGLLNSELDC